MNITKVRQILAAVVTVLSTVLALIGTDDVKAQTVTAYLVSCTPGTSVTGRMVWVGVYSYGTTQFERTFATMCPLSVQVQ